MPSRFPVHDLTLAEELVELYPDAVLVLDNESRCTHANSKACALLRTTLRELTAFALSDRLTQHSDHEWIWRGHDGEPLQLVIESHDLSCDRRWLRLRLKQETDAFTISVHSSKGQSSVYERAPGLVALIDSEFRYVQVNEGYRTWFGLHPKDVVGKTVPSVIGEEAFARVRPLMEKALGGEITSYNGVVQYRGGARYIQAHYVPVQAVSGSITAVVVTVTDLTQHKAIENAYWSSEERYQQSLESAGVGSCDWELRTNLMRMNRVASSFYGLDQKEVVDFTEALACVHPDDRHVVEQQYVLALSGAPSSCLEYRILKPNGGTHWLTCRSRLSFDESGYPNRLSQVLIDVTGLKLVEKERERLLIRERHARASVEQERQRLVTMIEQAPAGILIVRGPEFVIELINPMYQELVAHREVLHMRFRDAFPELANQGHYSVLENCYRTGQAWSAEDYPTLLTLPDGSTREVYHSVRMQPIRDGEGQVESILIFGYDVTPWVKARQQLQSNEQSLLAAEEDLRTQHQLLKGITDNTESALFMMDERGFATFMNPAAERITGFTLDELKEEPLHNFVHGQRPDGSEYPMHECPLGRAYALRMRVPSSEEVFIRKDGTFFPVRFAISPILDQGSLLGAVLEFQDITEQKKLEHDLTRAKEAAEAASRAKMQFLANMSHEIRTPMNAILGFSEVLATSELPGDEKERLASRINANGDQLLSLINDILDLSKFEAGGVPLEKTKCSVVQIARETIEALSPLASRKELQLMFEPQAGLNEWIVTDSVRLRQILTNLVGNSIKFTYKGHVRVSLTENVQTNGRCLTFQIADTGIGISDEDQRKLFHPFSQADSSINRKFGGSGLGLVLSRRLAQALGGDLKLVHSVAGAGSCFAVTIDAGNVNEGAIMINQSNTRSLDANDKMPQLKGVRVLLAEDSEDNAALVRIYLQREGANIEWAPDGEQARTKALSNDYDIILMDVQMPCLDGLEATRSLRASGYVRPIIALTAHALKEEVDRSLHAGCNAHLTKPINRKLLIDEIRRLTTAEDSAVTGA